MTWLLGIKFDPMADFLKPLGLDFFDGSSRV